MKKETQERVQKFVKAVRDNLPKKFVLEEKSIYFGFYFEGVKTISIDKNMKTLVYFLNTTKLDGIKLEGLRHISPKEAKDKHYGKVTAIYEGNDLNALATLVRKVAGILPAPKKPAPTPPTPQEAPTT